MERKLFKEVSCKTGEVFSAEVQEKGIFGCCTDCVEATPEEIEEAKKYYKEHGKCKVHLCYDSPGYDWCLRTCGICNKVIAEI